MVDPIGTCQALDLLTADQLEELFDESSGYLSKVDEIFDTVQIQEMQRNEQEHTNTQSDNDDNDDLNSKKRKKKKHKRTSSIITDKKCLILDVDNTLIYVRHFMDEMRVGDTVKLGDNNATVTALTYKLDLEFTENPGTMSAYDHTLKSVDDVIPKRGEWFPNESEKVAIIHQADPTGCCIKVDNDSDNEEISISFLSNSDELSQLEPMMNRPNYLAVTFMYGGYLVRIRPDLAQFLCRCNAKYDVVLFTAADGSVYNGLLKQVHHILKTELAQMKKSDFDYIIPHKLWQNVYFRSDCDEKHDEYGLPYRHKNLAKLGRELSTIVMVDDNPLSYRGFEPNSVRVAGFWGLESPQDRELMKTLFPTLWTIADHKDVRYHLSGLGQPPIDEQKESENMDSDDDLLNKQRTHSRKASAKFLQHLKEAIVAENESLEASSDDDEDEEQQSDLDQKDDSSVPMERSTESEDDSEQDNDSLDSVSESNTGNTQATIDKYTTMSSPSQSMINTEAKDIEQQKFSCLHSKSADMINKVAKTFLSSGSSLTTSQLDEIFNDEANISKEQQNKSRKEHKRNMTTESESGIGGAGTLIFDSYDEDILFRDAYHSPQQSADSSIFPKRPSLELDLDDTDQKQRETNARGSVPNTPHKESSEESEKDEMDKNVAQSMSHPSVESATISSKKTADTGLLHKNYAHDEHDNGLEIKHSGFIAIGGGNGSTTTTRNGDYEIERDRSPSTPITDENATILIEKTTGCSCFGWFGKKKKRKNVGLAQQELR